MDENPQLLKILKQNLNALNYFFGQIYYVAHFSLLRTLLLTASHSLTSLDLVGWAFRFSLAKVEEKGLYLSFPEISAISGILWSPLLSLVGTEGNAPAADFTMW